jgi:hypothetical protein
VNPAGVLLSGFLRLSTSLRVGITSLGLGRLLVLALLLLRLDLLAGLALTLTLVVELLVLGLDLVCSRGSVAAATGTVIVVSNCIYMVLM